MNAEDEKIEPKTDLELGLNYSNQCIRKKLTNDPGAGAGAGANAASRVDIRFVPAGSLSELVWSPDKGLSLKRADSSFTDKNASQFWDVGPSNMVLAPPESIIGVRSTTDIPIDDVLVKPVAAECVKSDISGKDTPARHPTKNSGDMSDSKAYEEHDKESGDNMEEMNAAERVSYAHNEQKNLVTGRGKNICNQVNSGTAENFERKRYKFCTNSDEPKPSLEQNPPLTGYMNEGRYNCIGNKAFESKIGPIIECKEAGAPGTKLTFSSGNPMEKLESTSENDLRAFNSEPACGARSRVLVPKSNKIVNESGDNEMMLYCHKNLSVAHSPGNSRSHVLRNKGKEKALSDGDTNINLSKDQDDSHESVESCNSAGLFLTGKKRWNFQQQLIVGSKRVKKQIEESSGSISLIKQDSSFMNWISNILKGFSQTIKNEANTAALTRSHPNHFHQWPDQKLVTDSKNRDPEPKSTGFQSIFQSIYCLSLKNIGTRVLTGNHQAGEGSKDFEPDKKAHGIDAAPITCCADLDVLNEQYVQSNELEGSTGGYDTGQSTQPKIEPINFVNSHDSSISDSVENKNCSKLALGEEKEGMTSNSSSGGQNTNNTENIESYALFEKKEADNNKRSDILGSLWITRFSPKSTTPLIISDDVNQSVDTQVHSANCSKLPQPHKQIAHLNKSKIKDSREQFADDGLLFEANELENCPINKEASIGPKNDWGITDHKSMYNLNPVSPSTRLRNSKPMASKFARRLDAIKHIIPSNRTDSSAQPNMTCLFCGKSGHQLYDCSEIASKELEDLLKNINPCQGLEEEACFCIKCFQSNHWAVSCPSSISRGQHELEGNAFANECDPIGIQFNQSNVESTRLLTDKEDQLSPGGTIIYEIDRNADGDLNLKRKLNEIITYEKIGSNVSIKKHLGSSLEENKLKENPMASPSSFVVRQNSDVPKRIFDAVKKLRLSRTDVLKWINSDMPMSHLDGLLLRLRLGKWEEGLGGTGYYVASINVTEAQKQSSGQSTGKSLCVNVGGIKCVVESQYISNHDFLEKEIMAWWCTTTRAGDIVPSEEDLIEKIKKKNMLGF